MSQTIVSVLVMLAAQLLPKIGVHIGSEELTNTITTLVTVFAGLWIWFRRVQIGDVKFLGTRKYE